MTALTRWLFGGAEITRLDAVRLIVASEPPVRTGPEDPKKKLARVVDLAQFAEQRATASEARSIA